MMVARSHVLDFAQNLPSVRGKYMIQFPLADINWLRVGGVADIVYMPADSDDLAGFLRSVSSDIPLYVIGAGSNLLVRDGGYRGVIIRLGRSFAHVQHEGAGCLRVGAAALDMRVARIACEAGLSGVEVFAGIPGTVGGAIAMNAGCYGRETCEILIRAIAYDRQGRRHMLGCDEMGFSYRHNTCADGLIFTEAHFALSKGAPHDIAARIDEISQARLQSQPQRVRTGGSTFKNPREYNIFDNVSEASKAARLPKAWELIDAAGCRGLRYNDAELSTTHCNFLINRGRACAADLETLAETARARVEADSGYALEWEIRRIGDTL